jgi:hypothetical protein
MNLDKLVPVAIAFALRAAATGNLPKVIHRIRLAEAHLIQGSEAN